MEDFNKTISSERLWEVMRQRHSVRQYKDEPVSQEQLAELRQMADIYNRTADLHIQVIDNDPSAFAGRLASYGKFRNVNNYIAMVGKKGKLLRQNIGFFGERIGLCMQNMGLNYCWVGLTFSKKSQRVEVMDDESYVAAIAFGHGANNGYAHKVKSRADVMEAKDAPQWFLDGVDAALLAPTAVNQQKFKFILNEDGSVTAKAGWGFFTQVDLGIAKCHFALGAGREVTWR